MYIRFEHMKSIPAHTQLSAAFHLFKSQTKHLLEGLAIAGDAQVAATAVGAAARATVQSTVAAIAWAVLIDHPDCLVYVLFLQILCGLDVFFCVFYVCFCLYVLFVAFYVDFVCGRFYVLYLKNLHYLENRRLVFQFWCYFSGEVSKLARNIWSIN